MVTGRTLTVTALGVALLGAAAGAQQAGSIRGVVLDAQFEAPVANAKVRLAETGEEVTATDEGTYVFGEVAPGTYTLVFWRDGYTRQVRGDVVVAPGRMTDVNVSLTGEFTEMEAFVVQDVQVGGATQEGLLLQRQEAPSLMDSVSQELMSQAAVSDAADALKLVAGTTVQEGKYAVVRGLPDRYVNSQMNGVRLPTADADKRAVQLDQFPSAVIESIQVSKTFTPDQQGDASGGAVNVVLKGIPEETMLKISVGAGVNRQVAFNEDYLIYQDRNTNTCVSAKKNEIPAEGPFGGPVGVSSDEGPIESSWSLAAGGKHVFDNGVKIGGFGNMYYKRDSSFHDNGIDDKYWVDNPGEPLTPKYSQGTPRQGEFYTSLFDVTQGSEEVQWGGLAVVGAEALDQKIDVVYMYTHIAESSATNAEDTRGQLHDWPGQTGQAPRRRNETVEYTERMTETLQVSGMHTLPIGEVGVQEFLMVLPPEFDWVVASSAAGMYQPDKRLFSTQWSPARKFGPFTLPAVHSQVKPTSSFNMGNLQRVWKEISEESDQFSINAKFPFEQWSRNEGYVKLGVFHDETFRTYEQESFSNFGETNANYFGEWDDLWSAHWPLEDHPMEPGEVDVDYEGEQRISAWYWMMDLPVCPFLNLIYGTRYETTELSIVNTPEENAQWVPPGADGSLTLTPGAADVAFEQEDMLPSLGFVFKMFDDLTLRGSYSRTVARQTFKELSPIQQTEYLGGDVFIGNPGLKMSALENYDLRLDFVPYQGGLVSVSWFHKDVIDPIEYVQEIASFVFTRPVNYPEGELTGVEIEVRQKLGEFVKELEGLTVGGNATFIESEVQIPESEQALLAALSAPMKSRDMTNAPERLYNLYATYEHPEWGTKVGLFYTVRGDMLVAGAGQSGGNFIPSVYEKEYGTLNFTFSQKLNDIWTVKFKAKNLTNPEIQEVYRSVYVKEGDKVKTSYRKGVEFSVSLSAEF